MSEQLIAPLFRGATKPVMFIGIPINALVLAVLPSIVIILIVWEWLGFLSLIFAIPSLIAIPVMRQITKQDDQYLSMFVLDLSEKIWIRKNKLGAVTIVPPHSLRSNKFIEE